MRIAFIGGVPASIGGGGLETQIGATADALRRRGHEVFRVEQEPEARPFDLLHAFGSDPDVGHMISHWRRNAAPLVVSPVIVVKPGIEERRQQIGVHLPIPVFGPRTRRHLLTRADLVVAQTQHEAKLVSAWTRPAKPRVVVVPNAVDPLPAAEPPGGVPAEYVLLLGTVSTRKNQVGTVGMLSRTGTRAVIAGGFDGTPEERERLVAEIARTEACWLGDLEDRRAVAGLLRGARALIHMSSAEGQSLAVIEALSVGTPAILSPLPAHRELRDAFPDHVRLAAGPKELSAALRSLPRDLQPAPIPTWDDVAAALEAQYERLVPVSHVAR